MRRRELLSTMAGVSLSLAGCLADGGPGSTPTQTPSPTETQTPPKTTGSPTRTTPTSTPPIETSTFTPSDGTDLAMGEPFTTDERMTVSVGSPTVRAMFVEFGEVHTDVASVEGVQFLIVDVSIDRKRTSVSDLRLAVEVDGQRSPAGRRYYFVHAPERAGTQLAFPVPHEPDPGSVAVVWPRDGADDVRWTVDDDAVLGILGQAPVFSVESFEVPDSAQAGASYDVSYTVSNTGERDGTFLTEIGSELISDHREYAVDVAAGETATNTVTLEPHVPDGTDEYDVVMNWGQDPLRRTVSVE